MENNELKLMVGDWCDYTDASLVTTKVKLEVSDLVLMDYISKNNDTTVIYQPIKLTPEIIDRIDFRKNYKIIGSWDYELFRFHTQRPYSVKDFTVVTECYYAERELFIHGGVQHLHQLQQLIRLFTGKEIEVKWEK